MSAPSSLAALPGLAAAPSADQEAFNARLARGLAKYPERAENYRRHQNAVRGQVLDYLPVKMDYEVVSRCNFRCIMCRVGEWPGGQRAADMPFDAFRRSLDQQYGLVEIKLQGVGEPLLHPDLPRMVALAAERHIWTRLTVNGSLLHVNENYRRLIDADPGEVQVSLDGASKAVFERIRRGSWFEKVTANAKLLNQYCLEQNLLKTRSWTVVQRDNLHELEDLVRLGAELKFPRMTFSVALSNWGLERWSASNRDLDVSASVSPERVAGLVELGHSLGVEVTFWNAGQKFQLGGDPKHLCAWLFERAFISSDLRIVPCCVLSSPEQVDLGDALDLDRIWNQAEYQKLRAAHLGGDVPDWCRQCYGM